MLTDRDWSPVWALSNVNLLHLVLHLQMAARYAANKQINLKKSEAAFRELIERLDCPEEGRSLSSHIWIWSNEWESQVLKSTVKHWHCVCVCFVLWQITRHRQLLSCISSFWALVQKMCTPVTFFCPTRDFWKLFWFNTFLFKQCFKYHNCWDGNTTFCFGATMPCWTTEPWLMIIYLVYSVEHAANAPKNTCFVSSFNIIKVIHILLPVQKWYFHSYQNHLQGVFGGLCGSSRKNWLWGGRLNNSHC